MAESKINSFALILTFCITINVASASDLNNFRKHNTSLILRPTLVEHKDEGDIITRTFKFGDENGRK